MRSVGQNAIPKRLSVYAPKAKYRILHTASPEFACSGMVKSGGVSPNVGTWPSANKAIAIPFQLLTDVTVYQLGWNNGTGTLSDSVDLGIYDTSWNRKVSTGGTARAGVTVQQWVDVTDTPLPPGRYYLVMSSNGVTSNNAYWSTTLSNAACVALGGCLDSPDALYPLPDPVTNMGTPTQVWRIPNVFIAIRTLW